MNRRTFLALAAVGLAGSTQISKLGITEGKAYTTWFPKDFDCPICKTKNTFQVIGSYGSYIYSWPSKYQWVFWPLTDSPSVYLCKKCHLATFMGDFETLPKDKLPLIQKELEKIPFQKTFKDYMEVPMTDRLEIVEKVCLLLPDQTDQFWNTFYRVKGYHYGQSKQSAKAAEARTKALDLTKKMLADPNGKTPQKELLYIAGAMRHFLKDDTGAVEDFTKGLATKFAAAGGNPKDMNNAEDGLNNRLKDYIASIKSPNPPRSTELEQ